MRGRFSRALLGLALLAAVAPGASPADASLPGPTPTRIVFSSDRTGNYELYSLNPDGTDLKQLTTGLADDIHPSVSPDGKTIAFSSNRHGGYDIWRMNADGSNQTRITTDDSTAEVDPAWSPDGTKLAIMRNVGQQFDIFTIDTSGQNATNLTKTSNINEGDISWAGDNSLIAYASDEGGDFEIHTIKPDGTSPKQLTSNKEDDFLPDWAPDSSSIAFTTWRRVSNADIFEMDPDGANQRPLVKTDDNETWASHSPDGRQLLFARQTGSRAARLAHPAAFIPARNGSLQNNDETDIKELFIYYLGFGFAIQVTDYGSFSGDGGWISTTTSCPVSEVEGYLEPSQGVWQDDNFFKQFDKTPNLLQISPTEYLAQLPMVAGRKSLLFGVWEPKNGPLRDDRYNIVIRGKVTGTVEVPVHMKFSELVNGTTIYTSSNMWMLKLDPPCGPATEFQTILPAPKGIPPDSAFAFGPPGEYVIRNELIRSDGGPTGLQVDVGGITVPTRGPRVLFVPLSVGETPAANPADLRAGAQALASALSRRGPDYMPIAQGPDALRTSVRAFLDIKPFLDAGKKEWLDFVGAPSEADIEGEIRLAKINQLFSFAAGSGRWDRVVAVLSGPGLDSLVGAGANGSSESTKVILTKTGVSQFTIGHEIAHSQPYLWSSDQMVAECGYDYHNKRDEQVAHGYQITLDGAENRAAKDPFNHLMAANADRWPDQCSYWHLLKEFQALKDPAVIVVQTRLLKEGKSYRGELLPAYQLPEGEIDTGRKGPGKWSIVLLNANGKSLGKFPFEAVFEREIEPVHIDRTLITMTFKLPKLKGVDAIRLVGPNGTLDTLRYSDSAPKVAIDDPFGGSAVSPTDGEVEVSWKGSDKDKGKLLYTLQYSSDGGETWSTELFESTATSGVVAVDDVTSHLVRVLVTDGARSSSDTAGFQTS